VWVLNLRDWTEKKTTCLKSSTDFSISNFQNSERTVSAPTQSIRTVRAGN
jgi:hypothetical protein